MTALQRLDAYLSGLDRRLRFFAGSRGLAVSSLSAFALTMLLVWIGNRYRFASGIVLPLRLLLCAGVAAAVVFTLALPLLRINRRKTALLAESRIPEFGERLLTVTERRDADNPFLELVAEDAMEVAGQHPAATLAPTGWLAGSLAAAAICAAALLWLITSAPGYWGYGAALLWGQSPRSVAPLYDIAVTPGDSTVRRRTDQIIGAELHGFSANSVVLHAKYEGALKWEQIPMQAQPSGNGYQLVFAGLSDSLEYFVEAGASRSKHFTLSVKDLPSIKRLRVAVHFPAEIKLPDAVQDPGGDIRAVEGSKAEVRILTDKPLKDAVLVMDNGARVPLVAGSDQWLSATLPIKNDGSYHVAALDKGEAVRMTDNFIIEARKDEAPSVVILKPGRDAGVSPIEELPVAVNSTDDFGLRSVDLHYSVNGGPEQVKAVAGGHDAKQVNGKALLALEDYKLAPGDLVSMYATATDAVHTSRSDIVFAKVEPFDLKFQQSQQSGGGGGGGGQEQSEISVRQKEIIAATWNQVKDPSKDAAGKEQNARFLSDMELKLSAQAAALAERMKDRELGDTSSQFQQFAKSMVEASGLMTNAVKQLRPGQWNAALGPEQKALQSILHAESLFREIQVSYGKQSGSGSGSSSGQERDLARLFDLELDNAKNQYEKGQSASPSQQESQKLDEQLEKLKELARRQQQLADEQHSAQQQFQQKWEEEQLRREAEQLRQQLKQQMAQNSGSQSQAQSQSQSQSSSSSQSSQSSGSSSSSSKEAMRQAMDSLSKAEDEMRNSGAQPNASAQKRAADQLTQAQQSLRNLRQQQANNGLADLAAKAKQLSSSQNDLGQRVKKLYGAEGVNTARTNEDGSVEMPEMNGPGFAGGWSRRHLRPMPDHAATNDEKRLATEGDKLADEMQQLQDQLHEQAKNLAAQKPDATRKLRKALSDAEQDELAVRMRKGSEWLRDGYGSKTWPIQDGITAATQRLSRQVEEARQAAEKGQPGSEAPDGDGSALGQALSQVRSLREQLQQAQSQAKSGSRTPGARGGEQQAAADQLGSLRSQLGGDNRQLNGYFNDAMGSLRRIDSQAGLLDARLSNNALINLQRLEVELARRMGQKGGARTGAPEDVPENYREAVATYFKNLSK